MLAGYHWWQYGQAIVQAAYYFFLNPLLYIAILLLLWESVRRGREQRMFFGFRTNGVWRPLMSLAALSLLVGLYLSIANLVVGVVVHPAEIWIISGLAVLLGLIRLRYASSIYAIGLFMLAALVSHWLPSSTGLALLDWLLSTLHQASVSSWLIVGVGVTLAEWFFFLIRKSGETGPALQHSRRGRSIGAVFIQNSAILPAVMLQPGSFHVHPEMFWHWPLTDASLHAYSLVAMPLLFGFSGLFASVDPIHVVRIHRRYALLLGVLLLGDAYLVSRYSALYALIGCFLIFVVKEVATWHLTYREVINDVLYPVSQEGVRVLGVARQSVAAAMGLVPGEVIAKINQIPVHSAYDLHFALDQNPAYAKLEVLDVNGEVRMVGKPVYTGERNKLGLILLPDEHRAKAYARIRAGWLQILYLRRRTLLDGRNESLVNEDSVTLSD